LKIFSVSENSNHLDITVLIPTYNRAEGLRETLEAMCQVDRDGLAVEFVVIEAPVEEGFLPSKITGAWAPWIQRVDRSGCALSSVNRGYRGGYPRPFCQAKAIAENW